MARTPLLRQIRQKIKDAQASRKTGVPIDEVPDIRAAKRALSRRNFLAGAAAGTALLTVPRRVMAASQPSVTIVGGGIAGLQCALELRDKGYASTVYEAQNKVGGRMFSNNGGYWQAGQVSEWCGELIDTGHKTIRNLAARYGLPLDDLHKAEPKNSDETYKFDGHYYAKATANADFLAMWDVLDADVTAAGYPTTFDSSTPEGAALDHMSVFDWIESRVPGGHNSNLGQLLDVAYNIEYGANTDVQSALNLVYLLGFQNSDPPTELDLFGVSDERFHVRGGNQLIPNAIAADLGGVKQGHSLTRLVQTPNGRYTCTFDRGNGCVDVTSDYVVLAIPFAVLRGIDTSHAGFDALKNTAIQQLGRGHNGKLQLQFTSRTWDGTGPWPGKANGTSYADSGYQSGWDVTRAQSGTQGILVMYSGGSNTDSMKTNSAYATASMDPNVSKDATHGLAQLKYMFPDLTWNGLATQSLPHKSPFFNASYSFWKTGQYTQFSGYEPVPMGGVYFCGEHTSQDFQGFMEGGAITGKETAKALAKVLR
jgi:monoamine oxidase